MMKNYSWFLLLLGALFYSCQAKKNISNSEKNSGIISCAPTVKDLDHPPGKDGKLAPLFSGLDVYHYPVTSSSKLAQAYFDQGFILNYGFNHAEAARSFQEAIRQDPECAMCYWGLAYVLGPNYNAGMEEDVLGMANSAIAQAKLLMHKASAKERALINALSKRYPREKGTDPDPYYEAYANAMKAVMRQYPEDPDIAVMTAEALMDLHPWDLWQKDGQARPWTPEIVQIIEGVLQKDPDHPQGMHLYIHALEAGPDPEKALTAAHNLRDRVPGSGHLLHMPSHLYINTGHYHEGSLANERAVKVDSAYVEACHAAGIYPLAYYPHNWHFLAACAALEGRGERAIEASRYMADFVVDQELMYQPELATLQHYYAIPWYTMVKFAKWSDILQEPQPDQALLYPNAIWRYARGMAHAAAGDLDKAQVQLDVIKEIEKNEAVQELTVWDINKIADLIDIAKYVLEGEIARRRGDLARSINLLTLAVEKEDQLNYNEPPDWFFSVRHVLGDVLLEAGRYTEAEKVYREDLQELKNNGWALKGLEVSLRKQGKNEAATAIRAKFKEVWQWADVSLNSSVL